MMTLVASRNVQAQGEWVAGFCLQALMVSPGSTFPLCEALALGVGQLPCVELLSISHQAMMMAKGSLLVLVMGWDLVE